MSQKIKLGITVGDINGVGLEVILKTIVNKQILDFCTPIIYGSSKVVSYHKNIVKIKDLSLNSIREADQADPNAVNVVNCWFDNVRITLGKLSEEGGKYAYISLEKATEDLMKRKIDALVTAPINKKAMQMASFPYAGHTEYLTAKFNHKESLMLMVHEGLRVGLVTNHIPIKEVAEKVTVDRVLKKLEIMHHTLCMDFGIDKPKIAVLGLNPHAGDEGALGEEETHVILPAIEAAKEKNIFALGPYPADGFFGSSNYNNFDGILAMYHDQGLVPFKALAFGGGINYTAGLPYIRTSPDHGTAYSIVGQNIANPDSFRRALFLAIDIVKQRQNFMDMTSNPLQPISLEEFEGLDKVEDEALTDEDDVTKQKENRSKDRSRSQQRRDRDHRSKHQHSKPKPQDAPPKTEPVVKEETQEASEVIKETIKQETPTPLPIEEKVIEEEETPIVKEENSNPPEHTPSDNPSDNQDQE